MPEWFENWVKPIVAGIAVGVMIATMVFFLRGIQSVDFLIEFIIKRAFGDIAQTTSDLNKAGAPDWIIKSLEFLLGSGLPLTAGMAFTVIVTPVLKLNRSGRPLVEHVWPGVPDILDSRIERPRADPIDPYAPARPFLGRELEMQTLMTFAISSMGEKSEILALTGVEGMGKTRVALAWLSKLKNNRWDIGVLKKSATLIDIERAYFRRKTAIVVDEPSSVTIDIYDILDTLMTKNKKLRILVVDRVIMPRSFGSPQSYVIPELRLEPLADSVLRELAPELPSQALASAEGRPLYALLGDDPARTIAARARQRLMEAKAFGGEEAQRLLALSALAGPTSYKSLSATRADLSLLRRLFEGAPRDLVSRILPALKPARFADAVLIQYAEERTEKALSELVSEAICANFSAVEARLWSLWTNISLTDIQSEVRYAIQIQFDEVKTDRVDFLKGMMGDFLNKIRDQVAAVEYERFDLQNTEKWLEIIINLSSRRPFDLSVRSLEVQAAFNAITFYGKAGRWDDLERWVRHLADLAASEPFRTDPAIRLSEAKAAFNAVTAYGRARRWDDLERWGRHLADLAASEPFRTDPAIRLSEAKAAVNAVIAYGRAGLHGTTETGWWRKRLAAAARAFPHDPSIQEHAGRFGLSNSEQFIQKMNYADT